MRLTIAAHSVASSCWGSLKWLDLVQAQIREARGELQNYKLLSVALVYVDTLEGPDS